MYAKRIFKVTLLPDRWRWIAGEGAMFISDWTGVRTAVTSEREREREGQTKICRKNEAKEWSC
jgi:hypothetical protein